MCDLQNDKNPGLFVYLLQFPDSMSPSVPESGSPFCSNEIQIQPPEDPRGHNQGEVQQGTSKFNMGLISYFTN